MSSQTDAHAPAQHALLDEIEQLRTALEATLDENVALIDDRDRLLRRVKTLSRDLQASREKQLRPPAPTPPTLVVRQSEAEEELRVAFEELQVLTEELEVANTSLHQTNQELDARVEERTLQIGEINAALRATEGSLRTIADLVPDLLWRADAEGQANWFNQRWFEFTGQDGDEPVGRGWTEAIHPLDREATFAALARAVEFGTSFHEQFRIRGADGDHRWFLIRAEPMLDDQGAVVAWFAAGTDVHEQRIALEALQQSETRFRTLIEGMPQLVWRAVDGGQWTWCSPQWTDYTGQPAEASCGRGWLDRFHPDDRQGAVSAWDAAEATGSLDIEARIVHAAEGRHRHFRTRAMPVRDGAGRIVEWLGTCTDVDDILQLQAEQQVLVGELQHRTRNLMAVVKSITARTLARSGSLDEFSARINDRFDALARVQSLLSRRAHSTRDVRRAGSRGIDDACRTRRRRPGRASLARWPDRRPAEVGNGADPGAGVA